MDKKLQPIVQVLEKDFGAEASESFGEVQAVLSKENLVAASQKLRDDFDFAFLSTITAVDYFPEESPRFHIVYIFRCLGENLQLSLLANILTEFFLKKTHWSTTLSETR